MLFICYTVIIVCADGLTSEELCPQQRLGSTVCDGPHICRDLLGIYILCMHKYNTSETAGVSECFVFYCDGIT